MKKLRISLSCTALLLIFISSCGQSNNNKNSTANPETTIVQYDSSIKLIYKNKNSFKLSDDEMQSIEKNLKGSINDYNAEQKKWFEKTFKDHPNEHAKLENYTINFSEYYKQYTSIINEKGEKEVLINCFCNKESWEKENIVIMDGGKCYFKVTINLKTMTYSKLRANGNA